MSMFPACTKLKKLAEIGTQTNTLKTSKQPLCVHAQLNLAATYLKWSIWTRLFCIGRWDTFLLVKMQTWNHGSSDGLSILLLHLLHTKPLHTAQMELYCTVMCCVVQYYIVLCCTVLYCRVDHGSCADNVLLFLENFSPQCASGGEKLGKNSKQISKPA